MPRLSLCMIVRDEQDMLPGLLEAVAPLAAELVVVDTGSRDRTAAIAAEAGARVIPFEWREDFAAARNAGLDAATGDWILCLDADERPGERLLGQITALLDDPRAGAATVVMRNEWPDGRATEADLLRVFRNDPQIRFRHRIHEDPSEGVAAFLQRSGLRLRRLDGTVRHLGYLREIAAARNKQQRDMDLLRRAVAEDPADLYSWFKLLEQARFWEDGPAWQEAAGRAAVPFDTAPAAALAARPWSGELAALIAQGLDTGPEAGLGWLDARSDRVRPTAAWHLRRGMWLEELGRDREADLAYRACLADGAGGDDPGLAALRPLLGLCRLAAGRGDLDSAVRLAGSAAGINPRDPEALLAVLSFTPPAKQSEAAADHAAAHPEARVPLARVLLEIGRCDLAFEVLSRSAAADSASALGLLTCALALGRDVDLIIDLEQEAADLALRSWVASLWRSRRTDAMLAFADNAPAVADAFPWLTGFITELTEEMSG